MPKGFFNFTPRERYLFTLFAGISAVVGGGICFFQTNKESPKEAIVPDTSQAVKKFLNSIRSTDPTSLDTVKSELHPYPFNPNNCDEDALAEVGLSHAQIQSFLHYRQAGKRFFTKGDLLKVYGWSASDVERMLPYVVFDKDERVLRKLERVATRQKHDSAYAAQKATYITKISKGTTIDPNLADSACLLHIPGIGPYFANRIIRYKKQLGGYICVEQLKEIPNFPQEALSYFAIKETPAISQIPINSADFKQLVHHPYLNFEQVKAIFHHRQLYGEIENLQQLSTESTFTEDDLRRLEPYLGTKRRN